MVCKTVMEAITFGSCHHAFHTGSDGEGLYYYSENGEDSLIGSSTFGFNKKGCEIMRLDAVDASFHGHYGSPLWSCIASYYSDDRTLCFVD